MRLPSSRPGSVRVAAYQDLPHGSLQAEWADRSGAVPYRPAFLGSTRPPGKGALSSGELPKQSGGVGHRPRRCLGETGDLRCWGRRPRFCLRLPWSQVSPAVLEKPSVPRRSSLVSQQHALLTERGEGRPPFIHKREKRVYRPEVEKARDNGKFRKASLMGNSEVIICMYLGLLCDLGLQTFTHNVCNNLIWFSTFQLPGEKTGSEE